MTVFRYSTAAARPLQDEVRQAFARALGGGSTAAGVDGWSPQVDIREEADRFVILADVPGVDPQAIEVQMENGILTLKGERAAGVDGEGAVHVRRERASGSFQRRFSLPEEADADGITASGRHGVLRIDIPKRPQAGARRIVVQ